MMDGTEENLTFSFEIKNCEKDYYYRICVTSKEEEIDNFETEKILCSKGGDDISFQKKMNCVFIFEKKQQISIITKKEKFYSNEENTKSNKRDKFLASLIMLKDGIYKRYINNSYNSEILSIKLQKDENESEKKYLFDYLKAGTRLSCFISLDFSMNADKEMIKSNKNILKHIFQGLEIYTKDQFFYPLGFGAKIKHTNNPAFDMSKSNVSSDTLLEQYKIFLESENIIPEKKIRVSPLIQKTINAIYKLFEPKVYNVSFILLSDDIDEKDKKDSIDNIITSSYLPLSIIAIGLGNDDYSISKEIFENKNKYSSQGMEKCRNNVIFTTLDSHSSSNEAILFCLRQLYKQMLEYYKLNKYNPEKDEKDNRNMLMGSISVVQSIMESVNILDNDPAPISINPYTKKISMPIKEGKIKIDIDGSTPGDEINQGNSNSYNGNAKTLTNDGNSPNLSNNINISNNSNDSNSLKESSRSCPGNVINPYKSNNNGKIRGNKSSQIKGINNDSGGTQSLSTKSSKNSEELKNSNDK